MLPPDLTTTRKEFLLALAGTPAVLAAPKPEPSNRKALIVVAHPDDEYAFAATVYRLARELGWAVDQVVVTNGEGGYRYATLAEAIYGVPLTDERHGRQLLPEIRRRETLAAGRILGIREHFFLDQHDSGFDSDKAQASTAAWDRPRILDALGDILARGEYDAVLTLQPTAQTHAHHREATRLALAAVARLPEGKRPAVLGAEPGLASQPVEVTPSLSFDRAASFGYQGSLNYQIVVNWVIAEHKSQGLFQTDALRHDVERFWVLTTEGGQSADVVRSLAAQLSGRAGLARNKGAR
jgi:LmbE family N-acetylglucosaminyl deacetylase